MRISWLITIAVCLQLAAQAAEPTALEQGWNNPPTSARLRAYWWWLNGQVTKAAITRDLEEMKAKGFGGALICDAGGAEQDGNDKVPPGPTFFTPEWRELYKHTLREADRLGLEMSLNIQSGWNLGGPNVTADDAAKKLVWSEARVSGPGKTNTKLPAPKSRDGYYRDLFLIAYPLKTTRQAENVLRVRTDSEQQAHPAKLLVDGDPNTFWVSAGNRQGQGPTRQNPSWAQFDFDSPVSINRFVLRPRPNYGPSECELQASEDGKEFRSVKGFRTDPAAETVIEFEAVTGRSFRLVVFSSYDPLWPKSPRNVQIAEVVLSGKAGVWPDIARSRPIQNWEQKAMHQTLHFSAPDTRPLLEDIPAQPGEEDTTTMKVVDLAGKMDAEGMLTWEVPPGTWQVLRFGCTIGDHSRVSTSSDGWKGYALDVLDAGAFQRYWDAIVEPLIQDAGPLAGRTLKYLHTDSWEVEAINWTPSFREEFRKRRGYDLLPYLPVVAGRIVASRPVSNRFLNDFRKTIGDLAIDNHYRPYRDWAHRKGLQIHPESGGPHAVPIDAQRCLGWNDVPMSEFWAWSWRHRVGESNRFFVKQPASAAHTYGRRLVAAEGFTTIGPHWQETLWDNLKPSFDRAACEGLNLLVWHAFVCSPLELGMPGIQYFAGTHFNPNTTWWKKSDAFLGYINRCQFMLQQGLFVADAAYYYGDHVPNFAQLKRSDPAGVLPGYDYDVMTEETILTGLTARDGRLFLPDGMSYRVLVLPNRTALSLPVLRKIKELVAGGATVIGPKPTEATSLQDFPANDAEVQKLAEELWGKAFAAGTPPGSPLPGRVIANRTAREVLLADKVPPDFEFKSANPNAVLDYIHRRDGEVDIYFVCNRSNTWEEATCTFRVAGKGPELWDPVTGRRDIAARFNEAAGRTSLPIQLPPYGSTFVVFGPQAVEAPPRAGRSYLAFTAQHTLSNSWRVAFDPKWGGPASADFPRLVNWTERPEPGIKYYSGTAVYSTRFDLPAKLSGQKENLWLDLGEVRELAEVRLNGRSLGIVWAPPFHVEISQNVKANDNILEVEVVNFWPNRIIGDQFLPGRETLHENQYPQIDERDSVDAFGPAWAGHSEERRIANSQR